MNIPPQAILLAVVAIIALGIAGVVLRPASTVAIIGFCAVAVPSLLNLLKSGEAAEKVKEVAVKLATTDARTSSQLDKMEATGEKTHTLVNSNMGVQLKLNAVLANRVADMTKDPSDIQAAALADKMLREHEGKQAVVDAKTLGN